MNKRSQILKLFPARRPVPPQPKVLEGCKTDYGTRELIEYAVAPGERISAYLLTPSGGKGRLPGMLASHQHGGQYYLGKSEPAGLSKNTMYHYGVDLCRQGCVVICPDHLSFEDRYAREIDRREKTVPKDRNYEAVMFAEQLVHGSSLTAKYLFDMCQAFDVLQDCQRVDRNRMGTIGHSLGGQTTMWHAFYDERVRAAFSSCGFCTLAAVQKYVISHNFAAYLPGMLQVGDLDDAVACIAPRAFGISNGTEDALFPMEGVAQVRQRAQKAFPKGKFLSIVFNGPHCFPDAVKRRAYAFLKKHLNG